MPAAIRGSRRLCHTPERRVRTVAGIEGRLTAHPMNAAKARTAAGTNRDRRNTD